MRKGWAAAALTFFLSPLLLAAPPAAQIAQCEACHGPGGNSAVPGTPSIAQQPVTAIENQLVYFREGLRHAPVMQSIAAGMKDEEITALARHFSGQKARPAAAGPPDRSLMGRGAELGEQRFCGQCHLRKYEGRAQMPRLAGQREDYLFDAMKAYRDGKRAGADTTMAEVLDGMSDADIKALAHYLSRLE